MGSRCCSGPGGPLGDAEAFGRRVTCKAPLAHLEGGSGRSEAPPTAILQDTHSLEGAFCEVGLSLLLRVCRLFFLYDLQALEHLEGEAHYAAVLALVLEVDGFIVVVDESLGEDSLVVIETLSPLRDSFALYLALLLPARFPRHLSHLLLAWLLTHLYTSPFSPSKMLPKRSSMYPRGDSNLYSPECVEKEFCELRHYGVLGSSRRPWPNW